MLFFLLCVVIVLSFKVFIPFCYLCCLFQFVVYFPLMSCLFFFYGSSFYCFSLWLLCVSPVSCRQPCTNTVRQCVWLAPPSLFKFVSSPLPLSRCHIHQCILWVLLGCYIWNIIGFLLLLLWISLSFSTDFLVTIYYFTKIQLNNFTGLALPMASALRSKHCLRHNFHGKCIHI